MANDKVQASVDFQSGGAPPALLGGVVCEFVIGAEANKKFTKSATSAAGGPAVIDEDNIQQAATTDVDGYIKFTKAGDYSAMKVGIKWVWTDNAQGGKTAKPSLNPLSVTYGLVQCAQAE